jgi:uncharacterized protein
MARDFPYEILGQTAHRPWPVPHRPWVMTQSWHDVLFAHWPVDIDALRATVPPALPVDVYDGHGWLGIVPFRMTNVAPRGVPAMSWFSVFPELNVRTYVTVGDRPGVYFLSLDAASVLAVTAARMLFGLPYHVAAMTVNHREGGVEYRSRRHTSADGKATFAAWYRPVGAARHPRPDSLEYFLTERYCLYTVDRSSRVRRVDIHHPPWLLQSAEADISENTMAEAVDLVVPPAAPLLHFCTRQDTVTWWSILA